MPHRVFFQKVPVELKASFSTSKLVPERRWIPELRLSFPKQCNIHWCYFKVINITQQLPGTLQRTWPSFHYIKLLYWSQWELDHSPVSIRVLSKIICDDWIMQVWTRGRQSRGQHVETWEEKSFEYRLDTSEMPQSVRFIKNRNNRFIKNRNKERLCIISSFKNWQNVWQANTFFLSELLNEVVHITDE